MLSELKNFRFDISLKKIRPLNRDNIAYRKASCPRCSVTIKSLYIPSVPRYAYFCNHCQILFER